METNLAAFFEQAPVALSVLDAEGRQVAANAAFRRLFRLDATGQLVSDLVTDPVDREITRAALARLRNGEVEEIDLEKLYVRPDGSRFRGRLRSRALRDAGGRFIGLIGSIEDVTDRHDARTRQHLPPLLTEPLAPTDAGDRPVRVLVVEDSPVNQALAAHQLNRLGHEHRILGTGGEAVELLRALAGDPAPFDPPPPFDIVLMDWNLPDMDGLEATRRIRADEAATGRTHVPIVAITANAMAGDRERCLGAGMDDFLAKPVTMEELGATVRRWTTGTRGSQERPTEPAGAGAPVRSPVPDEPEIDAEALAGFVRDVGDPEIVRSVVATFLQELGPRHDAVLRAATTGDRATVVRTTHVLRSAAALLGAARLAALCGRIEHAPADADLRADLDQLGTLTRTTAARLEDALLELLGE
jgi:PAS domain S-box-containing protein